MKKYDIFGGTDIKVTKIYPADYLVSELNKLQNDADKMEKIGVCQSCVIAIKAWIEDGLK